MAEKEITKDWQAEIPSLGIYQPRHLLRRVGPLLVGVCLDRDSSGEIYKPCFHVHCLGKEFPCVSLTLDTQLRSKHSGGPIYIEVKWHKQKYKEAAAQMVRQSLLCLEGNLRLQDVISAYRSHLITPMGRLQPVLLYQDMVILLAWGGDEKGALKLLAECLRVCPEAKFRPVGGRGVFEAQSRNLIGNQDSIRKTVESQIVLLRVEGLPQSGLLCG
jgi:hypothetical protein